jgi:histone H3/H4
MPAKSKAVRSKSNRLYKNDFSFEGAIKKVFKQVHPELHISSNALTQINAFINLLAKTIIKETHELVYKNYEPSSHIVSSRDIQTATRIVIMGELAKHAVREGTKAVTKFQSSKYNGFFHGSKAQKAGLVFNTARVEHILRKYFKKISASSSLYLSAVLEYITAEIMELSGNAAKDNKMKTISIRHVMFATDFDEELHNLKKRLHWDWAGAGSIPYIHSKLYPTKESINKKKRSSKKRSAKKQSLKKRKHSFGLKSQKKHGIVYRDNIQGITKPALIRLMRRAGISTQSGLVYEELRGIMKVFLEKLLKDAVEHMSHDRRRTMYKEDVFYASKMKMFPTVTSKKLAIYSFGASKALKEISYYQKHVGSLVPKEPFRRLVREVIQDYKADVKISKEAFDLIQEITETYMVSLLEDSLLAAIHSGNIRIRPKDFQLARRLRGE